MQLRFSVIVLLAYRLVHAEARLHSRTVGHTIQLPNDRRQGDQQLIQPWHEGQPWRLQEIPDPFLEPIACGQDAPSTLCDPELILLHDPGGSTPDSVKEALWDIERRNDKKDCGAYEMGVMVGGSLEKSARSRAETTQAFAEALVGRWRMGRAKCENGILLLLATEDQEVYIATGPGAKEALPRDHIDVVISRMRPLLLDGLFAGAVEQAANDVDKLLGGRPVEALEYDKRPKLTFDFVVLLVLFFIFCYLLSLAVDAWAKRQEERYHAQGVV